MVVGAGQPLQALATPLARPLTCEGEVLASPGGHVHRQPSLDLADRHDQANDAQRHRESLAQRGELVTRSDRLGEHEAHDSLVEEVGHDAGEISAHGPAAVAALVNAAPTEI